MHHRTQTLLLLKATHKSRSMLTQSQSFQNFMIRSTSSTSVESSSSSTTTTSTSAADLERIKREQLANLNLHKTTDQQQQEETEKQQAKKNKRKMYRTALTGVIAGAGLSGFAYFVLNSTLIDAQNEINHELKSVERVKTSDLLEAQLQSELKKEHEALLNRRSLAKQWMKSRSQGAYRYSAEDGLLMDKYKMNVKKGWNSWFHSMTDGMHDVEVEKQRREMALLEERIMNEVEVCTMLFDMMCMCMCVCFEY